MRRFWHTIFLSLVIILLPFPCFSTETTPTEDTSFASQPTEDSVVTDDNSGLSSQSPEPALSGWGLYFGLLHSHCDLSDGAGTVEEAFRQAANVEGLDFFAMTDHSNSFDNADSGSITADASVVSAEWAAGKVAAEAVTGSGFVGIFGYEMSWGNGLGHMNTFCTPGFQSWQQDGFDTYRTGLQNYYEALTSAPDSISQFNHPGILYGDFQDFDFYSEAFDAQITLLEVGSGDELPSAYEYYHRALDNGWHVAPTNNQNEHNGNWGTGSDRTVVYAHSLTEAGIYDAMRNYRVYATEDNDLSIYYSLDGHFMGSRIKKWSVGESADILVTFSDPTDAIGTVEVIVNGGASIAQQILTSGYGTLAFSLTPEYSYYYLRITQPDGDTAVTAPVWLEGEEYVGISAFSSDTALPVQGQELHLTLELYNDEAAELTVDQVDIAIDGETVLTQQDVCILPSGGKEAIPIPLTCGAVGHTVITATVTATLGGAPRVYRQELTLSFRKPDMVTDLLVDGTHGSAESYAQLAALAVENQIAVTTEMEAITAQMLENCSILLIPTPARSFEDTFLALVREFVGYGGSLILCGNGPEMNRLLEAVGSSMFYASENSGEMRYLSDFSTDSPWCRNLLPEQLYRCSGSLDCGKGNWVVKDTLAVEETGYGGRIFAGSGCWLSDDALTEPKNIWDPPSANCTIARNILGSTQVQLPLSTIADLRNGELGNLYRIRGYATSGTANPYNIFENTIYIQDDTGGIAVIPFDAEGISVGTPMEIIGYLAEQDKNKVLEVISCEILDAALYRYLPLEGDWKELLNNALHGGELVQAEGKVVTFRYTEDGRICELVLEDGGNFATVHIEDNIFSAATGYNDLASEVQVGRTFRAIGIVHMRADGVSVLRVRNCDEVVYVPPLNYFWEPAVADNPRVGDHIGLWLAAMILSAGLLKKLRRRRVM